MATSRRELGRIWSHDEIREDCKTAKAQFRHKRMLDPLVDYLNEFEVARVAADIVLEQLYSILSDPPNQEVLASIIGNAASCTSLRYLMAPPISADDLDTVLGTSVSATALRRDAELASSFADLLRQTIDPKRFPWVAAGAAPTEEQLRSAKLATAVVVAAQRVQTKRRGDEKKSLESQIEKLLVDMKFRKIPKPRTPIKVTEDMPGPGEYMTEVTLGEDNGDFIIGLYNRRRLALECKSSNSAVNSRKRLNKEVVKDANNWNGQFGSQVITGAALQGVFKPEYVEDAQNTPVLIYWAHRLEDLKEFIFSTR